MSVRGANNPFPFSATPLSAQFNSKCSQRGQSQRASSILTPLSIRNADNNLDLPMNKATKKPTSICIIAAAVLRNLELHLGLLKCLPFVTDNSWITAGSGVKQYSCHGFWFPLCYFLLSLVMLGSCSFQFPATPDTKQIIIFPSVYFAARANMHRNTAYKAESRHTIVPSGPMWIKH